jgi:hypothetical protein
MFQNLLTNYKNNDDNDKSIDVDNDDDDDYRGSDNEDSYDDYYSEIGINEEMKVW